MPRLWRDIGSSDCKGARANGPHDTRLRPQCVRTEFFEIYRYGAFRRSCFAISNKSVSQSVAYFEVPPALTPPPTRSPAPPPVSHVAFRPTVSNKGQSDGAPPCSPRCPARVKPSTQVLLSIHTRRVVRRGSRSVQCCLRQIAKISSAATRYAAFKVRIRHYHKLLTPNICLFRGMHARTFLTKAYDCYKTH